jgi:hypothetical protein
MASANKSPLGQGETHGFVNRRSTVQSRPPAPEANSSSSEATSTETWRPAVGFEGYEVSSHGHVRNARTGHVLKSCRNNRGYFQAFLSIRRRVIRPLVSRLVAEAFIGPCPPGLHVDHVNGNPADNRAENLEYVTAKENSRRALVLRAGEGASQ